MANTKVSRNGHFETCWSYGGILSGWTFALGGQLRASIWIYIWVPPVIRPITICYLWCIRSEAENYFSLDLLSFRSLPFCGPAAFVLRYSNTWLWGLQVFQLYSYHQRLLCRPKYWSKGRRIIMYSCTFHTNICTIGPRDHRIMKCLSHRNYTHKLSPYDVCCIELKRSANDITFTKHIHSFQTGKVAYIPWWLVGTNEPM